MGGFPRVVYGSEQQSFETFTTETSPVGIQLTIEDGRTFRFANIGSGAAAVNARVFQQIVPTGNQLIEDLDTISAGATLITGVGASGSGFAKNLMDRGYMMIDDVAQLDPIHQIREQTIVITTGTVGEFTLKSPIIDDVAAGEKINYFENPWRDIIVTPSTGATAPVVGVIVVAIAANSFGWVATSGPTRVLQDVAAWIAGEGTMVSENVAGAAQVWVPDTDQGGVETETMPLGPVVMIEGDAEKGVIWLRFIE